MMHIDGANMTISIAGNVNGRLPACGLWLEVGTKVVNRSDELSDPKCQTRHIRDQSSAQWFQRGGDEK